MDDMTMGLVALAIIAFVFTVMAVISDVIMPWYEKWIDEALRRDYENARKSVR